MKFQLVSNKPVWKVCNDCREKFDNTIYPAYILIDPVRLICSCCWEAYD